MARGHNGGGSLHPSFSRRVATATTSPPDQTPSAFEALALFATGHVFFHKRFFSCAPMLFLGYKWASVDPFHAVKLATILFMLHTLIARRKAGARYCTYVMDTGDQMVHSGVVHAK